MDMETLQQISPMTWIIIVAAIVITIAVLFNKAIKFALKIAAIAVAAAFVVYFLIQNGIIEPPPWGN